MLHVQTYLHELERQEGQPVSQPVSKEEKGKPDCCHAGIGAQEHGEFVFFFSGLFTRGFNAGHRFSVHGRFGVHERINVHGRFAVVVVKVVLGGWLRGTSDSFLQRSRNALWGRHHAEDGVLGILMGPERLMESLLLLRQVSQAPTAAIEKGKPTGLDMVLLRGGNELWWL
jgi:hypothetical protein